MAIELPDAARQQIGGLIERLRAHDATHAVRWVRPEGVHVTLRFLGETPEARVGGIGAALQAAASAVPPFDLALGPLGSFGSRRGARGQVIWVGLEGDLTELQGLVRLIESAFQGIGVRPERRPFAPHLTLGRARRAGGSLPTVLTADAAWPPSGAGFRVEAVSLMESDLRPDGARYTRRLGTPLGSRSL